MKRIASLISVALILTTAVVASADFTVFSGAKYDVVITNPVPVGVNPAGENLIGFMLRIINTTGDPRLDPAGFDGFTGARLGFYSTSPLFHNQYLQFTPTSPTLDDPDFATDIDTHFNLLTLDVLFVGAAPSETNALVGPNTAEPFNATGGFAAFANTDFGDRLFGNFSVVGGAAADVDGDADPTVWQLAYFAVPEGSLNPADPKIFMSAFVTAIDPGEEMIEVPIVVPEPATMSLLAFGGIVALIRRRK